MLSANDKINMSLDDIIKMEKREKKAFTPKKRSDSNNKKAVKKDIVQKKAFKKGRICVTFTMVLGKVQKKKEPQPQSGWALANEHEVHEQISHFGKRHTQTRRRSSTDWEMPAGETGGFALVRDSEDGFSVKIDLTYFQPTFSPDEVEVAVHEHDVQINARKEDPNNPNYALRELHRQYRMPDNVDLNTVRLSRGALSVNVDAKKIEGYGKPVSFQVVDVTQHRPDMHYL
ncbi:hypothetical protein QR680_006616 [Steinernema hermaphroditum]|uniref:SHSP domain-containing protein n=1 Tax=Steinernema hermaphroditum TaxID=289476 RepID=A0AA39HY78_9BILA|nr:hypothetical protein QR680_006616 [Steinernema hermaphroditum]